MDRKVMENAFHWNANQIYEYLESTALDSGRKDLGRLWTHLIRPVRDGTTYRTMGHYDVNNLGKLGGVAMNWVGPDGVPRDSFYRIADMFTAIGYLLAETTPIPPNAHGLNFGLPLLTMYGKWCLTLCADAGTKQECRPPTFACIGYVYEEDHLSNIVLGTCIGGGKYYRGSNWGKQRNWRKEGVVKAIWDKMDVTKAPLYDPPHCTIDWGNCAETYPLQLLKYCPTAKKAHVYGNVVRIWSGTPENQDGANVEGAQESNASGVDDLQERDNTLRQSGEKGISDLETLDLNEAQVYCMTSACPNCQLLIKELGGNPDNWVGNYWGVTGHHK